jgi:hypothetical protein
MLKVCEQFKATHGMGVRIVERGGRKLTSDVKSDPLGDKSCLRDTCPICSGSKPGRCDKAGIGYRQTCVPCRDNGVQATYEGESSRTAYARGLEHERDLETETDDSPLWKHCVIHHQEQKVKFEMEVTGVHRRAMYRLTDEIVRIKTSNSSIVLNSKNYWAQPQLTRVVAVTGNIQETQAGDVGDTRQERRAQRAAAVGRTASTPSTPASQKRRRRAALQPASQPASQSASQPVAVPLDREARRLRRAAASQ